MRLLLMGFYDCLIAVSHPREAAEEHLVLGEFHRMGHCCIIAVPIKQDDLSHPGLTVFDDKHIGFSIPGNQRGDRLV
jgi:hypothetical protein